MQDYTTALLLGFSFGNLWICTLLVFSFEIGSKALSLGYLLGRALAIVALSVAVSIIGSHVFVPKPVMNIASGVFLLSFASYLAATRIFSWIPPWKKGGEGGLTSHNCAECNACSHGSDPKFRSSCSDCRPSGLCEAEEPEVELLTRTSRKLKGKKSGPAAKGGFLAGLSLGAMRGAVLCGKLLVLLPVLMKSPWNKAVGLGVVFSLSSSVYPLMGFALGSVALSLVKYKRSLFVVSVVFMLALGVRYTWHGIVM